MSPEEDALALVVATLNRLGIPFMLTGSVASSYRGHHRATHDADLVAAGVLDLNPSIDRAYIERSAGDLGVSDLWRRIGGPINPARSSE